MILLSSSTLNYDCIEHEIRRRNAGLPGMCPADQFRQEKKKKKGTSQPISCHTFAENPLPALGSASIDKRWRISALECEDS